MIAGGAGRGDPVAPQRSGSAASPTARRKQPHPGGECLVDEIDAIGVENRSPLKLMEIAVEIIGAVLGDDVHRTDPLSLRNCSVASASSFR